MSGAICGCHSSGGGSATGISWVQTTGAAEPLATHRTAPQQRASAPDVNSTEAGRHLERFLFCVPSFKPLQPRDQPSFYLSGPS